MLGCEECAWESTEKEKIIGHIAQKHSWLIEGRIKCPYCPRRYRNMANMKTHLRKGRRPKHKRRTTRRDMGKYKTKTKELKGQEWGKEGGRKK